MANPDTPELFNVERWLRKSWMKDADLAVESGWVMYRSAQPTGEWSSCLVDVELDREESPPCGSFSVKTTRLISAVEPETFEQRRTIYMTEGESLLDYSKRVASALGRELVDNQWPVPTDLMQFIHLTLELIRSEGKDDEDDA